ncbi:MAG: hypothetical protein K6F54_03425 [Lachnospiraceae bacterium]|nr:hypothetical protein [Lachnospiraceae bacterium]
MIEEKTYEQLAEALSKERESNRILREVNSTLEREIEELRQELEETRESLEENTIAALKMGKSHNALFKELQETRRRFAKHSR